MSVAVGDSFQHIPREMRLSTDEVARKIVQFGESICGIELYAYQYVFAVTICTALLSRTGIAPTALFSRQSGKSEVVGLIAIACCVLLPALAQAFPDDPRVSVYARGFWVGGYAPKEEQAKIVFTRVRDYAESELAQTFYDDPEMGGISLISSRGDQVMWSNGSKMRARTASDNSKSEGDTWHMVLCDESQDISTLKIRKEILPMLAATNGVIVYIGTCGGSRGYYYDKIERNLKEEEEDGVRRHFHAPYNVVISDKQAKYDTEVVRYNKFCTATPAKQRLMLIEDPKAANRPNPFHLNYKNSVDTDIADYGGLAEAELDETFQLNYMLLWLTNLSAAIPYEVWASCQAPELELNRCGFSSKFLVAGLDVARGDGTQADKSVLTIGEVDILNPVQERPKVAKMTADNIVIRYAKTVIGMYEFAGDFEDVQYDSIIDTLALYPNVYFLKVDASGLGNPVCSRLTKLLPHIVVSPISWHAVANKSLCHKTFLMDVRAGMLRYAAGIATQNLTIYEKMQDEIKYLRRKISHGHLVLEAAGGKHDDIPDSLSLFCHGANEAVELYLNGGSTPTIEESDFTVGIHPITGYDANPVQSRSSRYLTRSRRGAGRAQRR